MTIDILEEIKKGNRLARMRMGQDAPDLVALKSVPSVRVALVPLKGKEDHLAWTAAASLEVEDNQYGTEVRDRWLKVNTLFHAMRHPEDIDKKIFPTPEDLDSELEDIDINYLSERYHLMKSDSSPALDGLTEEMMEELFPLWQQIDLRDLSGRSWDLAKGLLFETSQTSLMARWFGSSPTPNLTDETD